MDGYVIAVALWLWLFYIVANLFAADSSITGQFLMQKDCCFYGENGNTKFNADNCATTQDSRKLNVCLIIVQILEQAM